MFKLLVILFIVKLYARNNIKFVTSSLIDYVFTVHIDAGKQWSYFGFHA